MLPCRYVLWEYQTYKLWHAPNRTGSKAALGGLQQLPYGILLEAEFTMCRCWNDLWSITGNFRMCYLYAGPLGVSVLSIPFTFRISSATKAHAASCLLQFLLADKREYLLMMRDCRVAYRLGSLLEQIIADAKEAGGQAAAGLQVDCSPSVTSMIQLGCAPDIVPHTHVNNGIRVLAVERRALLQAGKCGTTAVACRPGYLCGREGKEERCCDDIRSAVCTACCHQLSQGPDSESIVLLSFGKVRLLAHTVVTVSMQPPTVPSWCQDHTRCVLTLGTE
jgi:hypothetical protein